MNLKHNIDQFSNNIMVFHISGKILAKEDVKSIQVDINQAIKENKIHIVLSLAELDYMNSTGLNFVISSFTKIRNAGGELVLCEVSQKVKELIIITKLDTIFGIYDTLEEATKSLETN